MKQIIWYLIIVKQAMINETQDIEISKRIQAQLYI